LAKFWLSLTWQGNADYKEVYENPTYATIGGLLKAVYGGMMDYWLAGPSFLTVSSWPGRICVMGYGFFIFITCASYTANLVSFMATVKVPPKTVTSLAHMLEIKGKMCILESAADSIKGAYGLEDESLLVVDAYEPAMENLYLGRCDVAMLGKNEYLKYVKAQKGVLYVCTDEADGRWWSECKDETVEPTEIRLECTCSDFSKSIEDCPDECPHANRYCPVQTTAPSFYFEFSFSLPVLPLVRMLCGCLYCSHACR